VIWRQANAFPSSIAATGFAPSTGTGPEGATQLVPSARTENYQLRSAWATCFLAAFVW